MAKGVHTSSIPNVTDGGTFLLIGVVLLLLARSLSTHTFPWPARTLGMPWYSFAVLIIVVDVLGYRVYLSQVGPKASKKDPLISGSPSNLSRAQSEMFAMPLVMSGQTSPGKSLATNGLTAASLKRRAANGRGARKKPRVSSGKEPPFTCSPGDLFHKTDAVPGWDTFACRVKNVWSVTKT